MDRDPSNTRNKDLYNKINNEVKSLETQETEGVKLRSKAQWRKDGEASLRYFCSLEKKGGGREIYEELQRVKDGPKVTATGGMLEQTRQFYVDLYTEEGGRGKRTRRNA